MSYVRSGALIAIIVFAVFAAYAFLAPATYRTSALLVVDSSNPASPATMPEPLEAARRLNEAILDRKTLEKLAKERSGSSAPEAQAQAASAIRRSLEIDTSDGHAFSISYRDQTAQRTQDACNTLTTRAAEVAPQVLLDKGAERAVDLKRQQQTQELAAFLALHPEVASVAPPTGDTSPDKDPVLSAFRAEKSNLEKRILELESGVQTTDNPYLDPKDSDVALLKRRLREIETGITARRQALEAKPTGAAALSPELLREWKRLLDAMSQASNDSDTLARPTLRARVETRAALPSSPLEPNRKLLLFLGAVFGGGLGTAFTLAMRSVQHRRIKSSRPPPQPARSQTALTVHLPAAPALPANLGPPVPALPPVAPSAPPIVPIPQRPISSNPPPSGSQAMPAAKPAAARSDRPPARRFASTLVLPPSENPSPLGPEENTPDPVLASANQAWEQQIRAHEVPGFAVVKPGSEPPPPLVARAAPSEPPEPPLPPLPVRSSSSGPPPAATIQRTISRPPNPMKVTQPLGSFVQEALLEAHRRGESVSTRPSLPPRSSSPPPVSQYSYVSTAPPSSSSMPAAPRSTPVRVQSVPASWRPDPSLTPQAQRGLCEQLVPFAVESCFVLAVVSVPEAIGYKSRVASEIALGLAESGHPRVLLLEGDLQRPWVQRMIGVDMPIATGFSQQLNARALGGQDTRWTVLGCTKSLHVLAEGMMRAPGLLLSKHFADCLRELRVYYDFIIIDGPSTSLDVDSGALDAVTDGIVTVCPAKGSPALAHMSSLFGKKRFSAFASSG